MFHRESIILLNFICPNSSRDRVMGYEPIDESSNLSWDANSIKTIGFSGAGVRSGSYFCGNDEIGKHDGFKYHCFGLWVQIPLPAPDKKSFFDFLKNL